MSENYKSFLQMDLSRYLGEWVAISGNKVIGHSKNINALKKELNKIKTTPLITKVPKKDTMIF